MGAFLQFLNFLAQNWFAILVLGLAVWAFFKLGIFAAIKGMLQRRETGPTGTVPATVVVRSFGAELAAGGRWVIVAFLLVLGMWGLIDPILPLDVIDAITYNTGTQTQRFAEEIVYAPGTEPQNDLNPVIQARTEAEGNQWLAEAAEAELRRLCTDPTWTITDTEVISITWGLTPMEFRSSELCSPGSRTGSELQRFWSALQPTSPITSTTPISPTITAERLQVWEEPVESAGGIPRAYYWVGIIIILTLCGAVLFGRIFR